MRLSASENSVALPSPSVPLPRARAFEESAVGASRYAVPSGFLWMADVIVLFAAFLVAWQLAPVLQHLFSAGRVADLRWLAWLSLPPADVAAGLRPLDEIAWIALTMIPVTLLAMQTAGGYRPLLAQSRTRVLLASALAPVAGLSVVTLVLIAVRNQNTSRALIFSLALLAGFGFASYRAAIRRYKTRRLRAGHYARNVVLIAPPDARQWLISHFKDHVDPCAHRLTGYLELPEEVPSSGRANERCERLGEVSELGDIVVHRPIHEVVAVQSAGSDEWLRGVIEQCEYFRVTLRLVPEALLSWSSTDLQVLFGRDALWLPEIVLRPRYLDDGALFVKRVFDIVVSATLLLLLAPVFAVIAIAIKLTTPRLTVFYPWRVVGYKGRPFTGYKFTTMVADADERKAELQHLNEMSGPVFKIKNDPRMTRLGRFLRKYSLNELPQLWSVLKGDMSLVGPRPAGPNELVRYELWHKRKLCVQPGVTCLWQVSGRNAISSFDDWVRMDFEYIDKWSLWLDIRILIRTAFAVFGGTGS